jgi:membrane protein involved in colicin uptake
MKLAGTLLFEAGKMLFKFGTWMLSKIGLDSTGGDPTKIGAKTAAEMATDQADADARNLANSRVAIRELETQLNRQKAKLQDAPTRGRGAEAMRESIAATIKKLEQDLADAKENAASLENYLREKAAADKKKAEEDAKPDESKAGDKRSELTTPDVQAMFASIEKTPELFSTVFGEFPAKAGEAGTRFSTNAMTSIRDGSAGAGEIYGNSAVAIIKAGVANMNVAVNATVKTTEPGSDQGARTAVG